MGRVGAEPAAAWRPRLAELSSPELRALLSETDEVIIPVGATEQHGPHLPLCTDSINIQAVAEDAARIERVLVAPTVVYGVSDNHLAFSGTISVRPQTLSALLVDVGTSLLRHGFRRLLLLNGHGGNYDAMSIAANKLRKSHPDALIALTDVVSFIYDGYEPASKIIYHADEGETAHTLAVAPDLVRMDRAVKEVSPSFNDYYQRYYVPGGEMTGRVSYGVPPTDSLSSTGVMGDPTLATREAGEQMHAVAVAGLRGIVQDLKHKKSMEQMQ
jgi:creatinine amidohydrolase